jgi:hypothetical protein
MTPASALTRYYGSLFKTIALSGIRLASSGHNIVRFDPYFSEDSRVVIPVSFSRYVVRDDLSAKRAAEYDNFLDAIFNKTAYLLRSGLIARVDVLATGEVQRVHWNDALANKVEQHFLNTHADILSKQSNVYTLDQWINMKGRDIFEERYRRIVSESTEGSEWYDLMLRTHSTLKDNSSSIKQSLAFQRIEYTAMSLMEDQYTHLVYAGPISIGWSYLYKRYEGVPIFSQVRVEKPNSEKKFISPDENEQTTGIVTSIITQVLTNPQFSPEKKERLVNSCMALFYTYGGLTFRNKPDALETKVVEDSSSYKSAFKHS